MSPFKSSFGRNFGKLVEGFKSSTIGSGLGGGGSRSLQRITATGGDTTYEPGNGYKYHRFDQPGTFEILLGYDEVDVLIVGGGGGGAGGDYGGGGGAGGVVFGSTQVGTQASGNPSVFVIGVGAGGAAGAAENGHGVSDPGQDSNFQSVFALGGGGGSSGPGGDPPNPVGDAGGSAGGSSYYNHPGVRDAAANTVPDEFINYGNSSGTSRTPGTVGGAGGGAGAAGVGYNGGAGVAILGFEYPLIGLSAYNPLSPTNNQYGAGGGGGPGGTGGEGGGGPSTQAGTDRLGGGGGAPGGNAASGKAGGSGIVVLRYKFP